MKHFNQECEACRKNDAHEERKARKKYEKSEIKNKRALHMLLSNCHDSEIKAFVKHVQKYGIDL